MVVIIDLTVGSMEGSEMLVCVVLVLASCKSASSGGAGVDVGGKLGGGLG